MTAGHAGNDQMPQLEKMGGGDGGMAQFMDVKDLGMIGQVLKNIVASNEPIVAKHFGDASTMLPYKDSQG